MQFWGFPNPNKSLIFCDEYITCESVNNVSQK